MFIALAHDFVLRRNCRITFSSKTPTPFTISSNGTHHVRLISHIAAKWNHLLGKEKRAKNAPRLVRLPELQVVSSGEKFGLVSSDYTNTFKGLIEVKLEVEEDPFDKQEVGAFDPAEMLKSMNIDPNLLNIPEARTIPSRTSVIELSPSATAVGHPITTAPIDLTAEPIASSTNSNRSVLATPSVGNKRKSESVQDYDLSTDTALASLTIKRARVDDCVPTEQVSLRTVMKRNVL